MTPLEPSIRLEKSTSRTACSTCGLEDGTTLCLYFSWSSPSTLSGGGTSVALCHECRMRTFFTLRETFERDLKHDRGHPRTEAELSHIPHPSECNQENT